MNPDMDYRGYKDETMLRAMREQRVLHTARIIASAAAIMALIIAFYWMA
jgi:hypothetical protein